MFERYKNDKSVDPSIVISNLKTEKD
jgi:hypothetical protein